jgi:hypothetical protein
MAGHLQSDREIFAYINLIIKNIPLKMNKRSKIFITETAYKSFIEIKGNDKAPHTVARLLSCDPKSRRLTQSQDSCLVTKNLKTPSSPLKKPHSFKTLTTLLSSPYKTLLITPQALS